MTNDTDTAIVDCSAGAGVSTPASTEQLCFHCGAACRGAGRVRHDKSFCCAGCLTVYELLTENGLGDFYQLGERAGVRVRERAPEEQYGYLDQPAVRERLVDFADERLTRVTFRLPAIHCIACVWLLENLFHLKPGIGASRVNFPRREAAITFETARVQLSEVAALLSALGYEPELRWSDLDGARKDPVARRLWMQTGIAGFAFGNIMLFSISSYLGLDHFSGPNFEKLFGWLSLALALPVFFYSAADYWRSAWVSVRQRCLTIDVPIAAGIAALFAQSVYEVVCGRGAGYFDSLAGLLFFLLCGKLFQRSACDRLTFDRDYKSFFPLSITRKRSRRADGVGPGPEEERVSLSQLRVGDRLILRNGELIPADARLVAGPAVVDYSFVTGESEPVEKKPEDYLYAGGRQIGGAIEVETVKPVSQSYLTSLWNQDAFVKERAETLHTLTNRYSRRFTKIVIAIAAGAALFWALREPARSLRAFTAVLIVACPCALALAAPFALGTALRVLARRNVFLKNPGVLEALARVDAVVFDKTGTLTAAGAGSVVFHGAPLSEAEERRLYSMTRHSTHPLVVRIGDAIARDHFPDPVRSFRETTGCGIEGNVGGNEIWMGSAAWLESRGVPAREQDGARGATGGPARAPVRDGSEEDSRAAAGSVVHVAINGSHRGCFVLASALRPQADRLIEDLAARYELALLSGDHDKERGRFAGLFGASALHFNQSPLHKLEFVRQLQRGDKTVMMVGDGLNDAGALKQSDVGVAVVENLNAFSPASDAIMAASAVPRLPEVLRYSRAAVRVVRLSFLISSVYNVVGVSIAAQGLLSPVICAILMPLSSVTVVAFASGATTWLGRRLDAKASESTLPRARARFAGAGPARHSDRADSPRGGPEELEAAP